MAGTAGRSGRRPKPTARKALAGNPGKRALNKDEPVFTPIKGVEPPEWFAEEDLPLATIMWQLTTKELCGQGLLCVTDLAVCGLWKRDPAVLMSAMMLAIRALAGNEKLIC